MIHTTNRYSIFISGGKQYQAIEGKTVAVDKIQGEIGDKVIISEVLFRKRDENDFEVGRPYLTGNVQATIIRQDKGPKIDVIRFKRRKKVRVRKGHRQQFTVLRIEAI